MSWKTLVDPQALAAELGRDDLVALDCRHLLAEPDAGRRAWHESHLPAAHHAHTDRDLSDGERILKHGQGRHPLPRPDAFRAAAERWGVAPGVQVVCYDDMSGALSAARAWWLLKDHGHDDVAVLDGGWSGWLEAGLPLDAGPPRQRQGSLPAGPGHMPRMELEDVVRAVSGRGEGFAFLDVRDPDRYAGRAEPIDPVAGHIPGAANLPFKDLLDADGRFLPKPELEALLRREVLRNDGRRPAAYCGSGVTACHLVLAAVHAGLPPPALYPGGWSQWVRDPKRPVARQSLPTR